jgi:hypothetical protein
MFGSAEFGRIFLVQIFGVVGLATTNQHFPVVNYDFSLLQLLVSSLANTYVGT